MRIRLAAELSACVCLVAACSGGNTTGNASGARAVTPSSVANKIIPYSSAALGTTVWTNASCGRLEAPAVPSRVQIPHYGENVGLAVDGNGAAWFAGFSSVVCFGAGHSFHQFPLGAHAQPINFRTGPDGSVWFGDPIYGRLGRIATNGLLTERQVAPGVIQPDGTLAQNSYHPHDIGIGPDGSVWFDVNTAGAGLARMRPDGSVTTYPNQSGLSLTIDTHGNLWIPGPDGVVRITNAGGVSESQLNSYTHQLVEGSDGRMWFLVAGCARQTQIGWTDASGQTQLLDAPLADGTAFRDAMVRAPDGALWFPTADGRLVRLASETDVTVYNLPWPDATIGLFVVLPGNHILMESWTIGLGHLEMLDFTAANGTRADGLNAIPPPPSHDSRDAANATAYSIVTAAYAAAAPASSASAKIWLRGFWEGDHAALFKYVINENRCDPAYLSVYLFEDSAGWHRYDVMPWFGSFTLPEPNGNLLLKFQSGCINMHQSPSLGSQVARCLPSGTSVEVDQLPVYADGDIWWHVVSHDSSRVPLGWGVQKYLVCSDYWIGRLPQC